MRYLILSDMHGNGEALDAVLAEASPEDFGVILVLGDLVGYGASPDRVVERVRELPGTVHAIRGNHDKVVAGLEEGHSFNRVALAAARWTRESMRPENLRYLEELPRGPVVTEEELVICHGSPLDEDDYVLSEMDAGWIFRDHDPWLTFFGHTHLPTAYVLTDGGVRERREERLELDPGSRYLINPGSVGQPRDRDPRAAYLTFDSDSRELRWLRVEYPVEEAQERILAAGLPSTLAERLALGF